MPVFAGWCLLAATFSCGDATRNLIMPKRKTATPPMTCSVDASCPAARPVCDTTTAQCRLCTDSAECLPPNWPYCDLTSGTCVECLKNEECADAARPICSGHRCVECVTNAHCPSPDTSCNVVSGLCSVACDTATQCPFDAPYCDVNVKFCVECLRDGDCPTMFPFCRMSTCLP